MVNYQKNSIIGMTILGMLASSQMSISYSFAEDFGDFDQKLIKSSKNFQGKIPKTILTETLVDGRLEVKRYHLPDNLTSNDLGRMLPTNQETNNWAYVNHKGYQPGIVLYDGKATRIGENLWEISQDSSESIHQDLNLESVSPIQGKINENIAFKVIFSGKNAESESYGIILANQSMKTIENDHSLKELKNCEFIKNSNFSNQGLKNLAEMG